MTSEEPIKRCTTCGEDKPVTDFHRDKRRRDSLQSKCKSCACEAARLWRLANLDRDRETNRRYVVTHPGYHTQYSRAWRAANPDKAEEQRRRQAPYLAEWTRQEHARLRAAVLDHYGSSCACCGSTDYLSIDHVNGDGEEHRKQVGIRTGTKTYRWLVRNNFPEGFQTLCAACNASKRSGTSCRLAH